MIEQFLNNGGFGITYLAKDSLLRRVVIKECFPESICRRANSTVRVRSRDQADAFRAIVDLFIEEARGLARLSHPNIVGVHQVFEDNDTAYMAMDFVAGRDLLEIAETSEVLDPKVF
ncbi:MAG: serine/threonine protein kinase, partial [Pseudomonadota bacterium]